MPVHVWTQVNSGLFHHFHRVWSVEIARALNGGLLKGYDIVSQGNKESRHARRLLAEKAVAFLRNGIRLLIVDLFPPATEGGNRHATT